MTGTPYAKSNPIFWFPAPHCLLTMILLGGSDEDLRVFTSETSNAKAKSSENFLSPDQNGPNLGGFWGLGVRWYKNFQFLFQKAHPCPNPHRLSHFAWRLVEGSDPQGCWRKKSRKSQNLPLEWCIAVNTGLHSRAPVICSTHSEMGPVWQNPIQRTVRTAHLSVLMTVHNFSTQYKKEQFW